MNRAHVLKIDGLAKSYRGAFGRRQRVLAGLAFQVERGEVYGLLGRNGAGKSTTFRLMMGLARADAGRIEILGGRPGERQVLMRIGFCPESPQFPPNLRVGEVLRFHAALARERVLTPRNRIAWLLDQFELSDERQRLVATLSRGTTQRLALAVAVLARPELLVLDEPLTALDPLSRQRVLSLLSELKRSGTAMIISSHIVSDLEDIVDRLGVLAKGNLARELSFAGRGADASRAMAIRIPSDFVKQVAADVPEIESVREGEVLCFGGIPFDRAQELVKHWSAAGIPILGMQPQRSGAGKDILPDILAAAAEDPQPVETVKELP